jgi:glycosyltransferase involved in cell wall biosynthesis
MTSYTLMTSAHNEARFLPDAIASILAQTLRPDLWIIVSDGSTDDTDRIAAAAAAEHGFIRFLRFDNPARSPYPMGGIAWKKVSALDAGLAAFGPVTSDYLGNIDGDVTFAPDFFARLLARMDADPGIGIGGGFVYNQADGRREPYFINPDVVGGPAQIFRRPVFEAIGGYIPWGQEDTIAQIMVRMHGYRVRSFADLEVLHHKVASRKNSTRSGASSIPAPWSAPCASIRCTWRRAAPPSSAAIRSATWRGSAASAGRPSPGSRPGCRRR